MGAALTRYGDLALAAMVVGIVGMMIIPLPTFVLDLLITSNIAISVVMLLVSIYVPNALRIAAFPSILLITTLFRLGLNVSSTRLILLQADAGEVIYSFGNFVVAGNLVVGAVIFLILTLIQFVVIAKGSERVAEVAARFTLDAMPGRQMAIDADVRAGAIEMDDARKLRASLQRESQLYGSMDGAMKFVKGDAIAGILIAIVNIVGGLLIGVLQRGMSAGEAAQLYSVLTIGDGLVSQIPALLMSIASGIVVTRVASEDGSSHLGQDIGQQVLAQPRAIGIAAGLLALLAAVPGLPAVPFLLLSVVAGGATYLVKRRQAEGRVAAKGARGGRGRRGQREAAPGDASGEEAPEDEVTMPSAVALEVGSALASLVDASSEGGRFLRELVPGLRELLNTELGLILPGVHVRPGPALLGPEEYRILLAEVPVASGALVPETVLALAGPAQLAELGVSAPFPVEAPGVAPPCCRVAAAEAARLASLGVQLVEAPTQLVLHLGRVLRLHGSELIGIQETQQLLDKLEATHPALVHEVVPKLISIHTLSEVLRRLVEEGVSIRNLREVLHCLAEWGPLEKDPVVLTEYVRGALRRQVSYRYAGPSQQIRALLLDPMIEQTVRDSIQRTPKGSYLALEPELGRDILQAFHAQVGGWPGEEPLPVVLTTVDVRRYVRRLIETDFPDLAVLSYNELLPTVTVQPMARIAVG
ncbi:MAG: type III secretion system export apparatus subunit SctV [Deltaproteobacteria bacterium]|nr:type III secretion system export apparatus subunit SctV [Deltaproteobacteria bacterium]